MTRVALVALALSFGVGAALGAAPPTPVVCGASGCTSLRTSTLMGLLTLPAALDPAEPPPAQPFFLFTAVDLEGVKSRVYYVPDRAEALLGFGGDAGWRRVPVDDARLLADAAAGTTPFPAPASDALAASPFGSGPTSDRGAEAWIAIVGALCFAAVVFAVVTRTRRRADLA